MQNTIFVHTMISLGMSRKSAEEFERHLDDKHPAGMNPTKLYQYFREYAKQQNADLCGHISDLMEENEKLDALNEVLRCPI